MCCRRHHASSRLDYQLLRSSAIYLKYKIDVLTLLYLGYNTVFLMTIISKV